MNKAKSQKLTGISCIILLIVLVILLLLSGCAPRPIVETEPPPSYTVWKEPATSEAEELMRKSWGEWRIVVAMIGAKEYQAAWERGRLILARWGEILHRSSDASHDPSATGPHLPGGGESSAGAAPNIQPSVPPEPTPLSPDALGVEQRASEAHEEMGDTDEDD